MDDQQKLELAADWIAGADALLIGTGAGMGVDSGLPDFRGNAGFWTAYPPFRGRMFAEISNPSWFQRDPHLAWGFFGHRLSLYRQSEPHQGYHILRRWLDRFAEHGFVFTSNVDGHCQRAGFDPSRLMECHGSILRLQCTVPCRDDVWSADGLELQVDMEQVRAISELPRCKSCGGLARPNLLMFGDGHWVSKITDEQAERLDRWRQQVAGRSIVAVEIGAGLGVPTVRRVCEQLADRLIRINPRDAQTPAHGLGLALGARDALQRIDELLGDWQ